MGANDWVVFGLTSSLDLKCKREEFVEPEVDLKRNSTQTRVKHGFNDESLKLFGAPVSVKQLYHSNIFLRFIPSIDASS